MCSPWKRTFTLAPLAFLTMFSLQGFDLNFKKKEICKKIIKVLGKTCIGSSKVAF
jgi:hypothetical protein